MASWIAMTLVGSVAFVLWATDLHHLTLVTLVATVVLGISGIAWLLYGQQFERPQLRLGLVALLVLAVAALVLLGWAQGGPLKENYLKNPTVFQAVSAWGFVPLVPAIVGWRLLAGTLRKSVPIDSAVAWLFLGCLAVALGLAAKTDGDPLQFLQVTISPIIPWLIVWALGVWGRWRSWGIAARVPAMIASVVWGYVGAWLMFGVLLWQGFHS